MRSVIIHGVLALVGLTFAYIVWTSKADLSETLGDVLVMDCEPDKITSVMLRENKRKVVLARKEIAGEQVLWIEESKEAQKEGGAKEETTSFVGGEGAVEYVEKVAPLRALRSLGVIKKEDRKEFELEDPKSKLTIACGNKKATYEFGGSTYGSNDRYLRPSGKDNVYLVGADIVEQLRTPQSKLMERRMHAFKSSDVETLKVEAGTKARTLLQRNRIDPMKAEWVDASAPDRRNELYGNWLQRIAQLRVQTYLAMQQKPGDELDAGEAASAESLMRLQYAAANGREIGRLELVKVKSSTDQVYAKTETTHGWVKVPASVASQVVDDLAAVLGGKVVAPRDADEAQGSGSSAPGGGTTGTTVDPSAGDALPPGHPPIGAPD